MTLFWRGKNKITLTPQGHLFLSSAQDIVNHYVSALTDLKQFNDTQHTLRVGYFSAFEQPLLQRPLFELLKQVPNLSLAVTEGSNEHLTQSVRNGNLDLAMSISYGKSAVETSSELTSQSVFDSMMVMGVSTLNPLSKKRELLPEDLTERPILYYSPESSTFLLESFLASMSFLHDYDQIQRVSSAEQMHLLVALDQAFAFYPSGLLPDNDQSTDGQVRYLPMAGDVSQGYQIVALHNPGNQNPMLKRLLTIMNDIKGTTTD